MLDLLGKIAAGCPRLKPFGNDRCGAYYAKLAQRAAASSDLFQTNGVWYKKFTIKPFTGKTIVQTNTN